MLDCLVPGQPFRTGLQVVTGTHTHISTHANKYTHTHNPTLTPGVEISLKRSHFKKLESEIKVIVQYSL